MSGAQNAVDDALRWLRHRDRSSRELDGRLEQRGYSQHEREGAIETLLRTGVLDDRRFAETRATSLAARGAGDSLIRHKLLEAGLSHELVAEALLVVPAEVERARVVVSRRGNGPKTARYLHGKGFSEDVVADLLAD